MPQNLLTPPPAPDLAGTPPPPPQADLHAVVEEEARKQGVDPDLVHRLIKRESGWNPFAVSSAGAQGLMQLMPDTAAAYGVKNPFDPVENVRAGTKYLRKLLDDNKGDRRLALASYNAGPAQVKRFGDVPPFPETQKYVADLAPSGPEPVHPAQFKFDDAPQGEHVDPQAFQFSDPTSSVEQAGTHAARGAQRLTPEYGPIVQFLRTLPATVGSFAGNLSKATGPVGAAVGTGLSALGAAAGEVGTMGAEYFAHDAGLTGVPPPSPEGAISRVEDAAMAGAGGELAGRVGGPILQRIAAPFAPSVDAAGREVQRAFPNALPNQIADSHTLDTLTHVAEHAPFTGSGIAERKALLANQAQQKAMGIVQHYGGPIAPEQAGKAFTDALEQNTQAFKSHAAKLYADVDTASKGVKVDLSPLQEYASQELEKRAGVPGEVSGNRGLKMLQQVASAGKDSEVGQQAQSMAQALGVDTKEFLTNPSYAKLRDSLGVTDVAMAKDMTFQQAQHFRSDLNSFVRRATSKKDDVAKGVAQQLIKRLDVAMDTAGKASGASDAYRAANDFYKTGKQQYESHLMRSLVDQYPEDIADKLVTSGATTPIREARAAVGPDGWKGIQAHVANKLIEGSTNPEGTVIDGSKLLGKLRELSPQTIREVFPGDHAQDLWTLGRVLDRAQRTTSGTGRMGIYLGQAGLVTGLIHHGTEGANLGAGVILLGPAALSRLMATPFGAKWLSVGFQAGKGTKLAAQAAKAATKLIAQLGVERDAPPSPQVGQPPPGP